MKCWHLSAWFLAAALMACGGGGGASSAPAAATPAPVATPDPIAALSVKVDTNTTDASGVFFGIFREGGAKASLVDAASAELRMQPASFMWFQAWAGQPDFPTADVQALAQKGVLAHIAWEPWDPAKTVDASDQIHLQDILDGKWDAYITKWAKAAKDTDTPILLRWGHEMNGNWYPWACAMNGKDPAKYVSAFRHVHDLFTAQGATKVQWVWCLNNDPVPSEAWNDPAGLYPGDAYVDWMGLDGYNWGTGVSYGSWRTFESLFASAYDKVQAISSAKPVLVAEFASSTVGGDKAAWMTDLFKTLPTRFPKMKGFTWFDIQKEQDWRIRSSQSSFEAFALGLRADWVRGNGSAMAKVAQPVS